MVDSFNISKFKASIEKSYHRAAHFNMELTPPQGLRALDLDGSLAQGSSFFETTKKLHFNIESTNLPGFALATDENRRYGYGTTRLKPYVGIYDSLTINVRSDSAGRNYEFFQSWMKLIFNYDNSIGSMDTNNGFGLGGRASVYEMNYKKDYSTIANINVYDEEGGDPTIMLYFSDIYPIHLGNATLDWNDPNILKFPVTLTFSDWYNGRNVTPGRVVEGQLPTVTSP